MTTRPTQEAHRWLAAGHRYDDVDLWQELCGLLDARGLVPTAELPDHLAPLAFRDPANTYQEWLREQHLLPIAHLQRRSTRGGNGWRTHRDWRARLAVMRDPTPSNLLAWWRALEPVMRAHCLKRLEGINVLIYDPDAATAPRLPFRTATFPHYQCSLCKGESWADDPRGILHRWRSGSAEGLPLFGPSQPRRSADCPLLRLRTQIRAAERAERPDAPEPPLAAELRRIAEGDLRAADESRAAFWQALAGARWRTTGASASHGRLGWAASHIAQTCAVWIEPTEASVREHAAYLRGEGDWPRSTAEEDTQRRIMAMYAAVADQLEALLA